MRLRKSTAVPFDGTPPGVHRGELIQVRDASGRWHPRIAGGSARYDFDKAIGGRCYLTVPVCDPAEWECTGAEPAAVNWPAEHVRTDDTEETP